MLPVAILKFWDSLDAASLAARSLNWLGTTFELCCSSGMPWLAVPLCAVAWAIFSCGIFVGGWFQMFFFRFGFNWGFWPLLTPLRYLRYQRWLWEAHGSTMVHGWMENISKPRWRKKVLDQTAMASLLQQPSVRFFSGSFCIFLRWPLPGAVITACTPSLAPQDLWLWVCYWSSWPNSKNKALR